MIAPARAGPGQLRLSQMRASPISDLHARADALVEPYGPVGDSAAVDLVQTYGPFEAEYAAIRKSAGLMDLPMRATLVVTGTERLSFLNRMLTQELKGAQPWSARESFWLNRKGRIDADVRVIVLPDRVLLDVDVHAASRAMVGLGSYIISEDVAIADETATHHRLALHGPGATAALARLATQRGGAALSTMAVGEVAEVEVAGARVVVDRRDSTGDVGLELLVARSEGTTAVYMALLELAHEHAAPGESGEPARPNPRPGLRPIGWAAFNVARIEAGTPLYLLDFGPDSLPAESGVLDRRVSFTKGCYLGQEIVARMHSLGKPKQVVVGLRLVDPQAVAEVARQHDGAAEVAAPRLARQPVTGSAIYTPAAIDAWRTANAAATGAAQAPAAPVPVGAVTSSTLAPMLSQAPIALAMVRFEHAAAGTALLVDCDGALLPATVQSTLTFWKR